MKKIILLIILFFSLFPTIKQNRLIFTGMQSVCAQDLSWEGSDGTKYPPTVLMNATSGNPDGSIKATAFLKDCDNCDPDKTSINWSITDANATDISSDVTFSPSQTFTSGQEVVISHLNAGLYDVTVSGNVYIPQPDICYNNGQCYPAVDEEVFVSLNGDVTVGEGHTCGYTYNGQASIAEVPTTFKDYHIDYTPIKWGITDDEYIDVEIGACTDGINWTAKLISITGYYSERWRLKPGVAEVTGTGGNTTKSNFCSQVSSLTNFGAGSWYMISAVKAHEDVHVTHLLPALQDVSNAINDLVNTLQVPDNGQTENDAITQIKQLNDYSIKIKNYDSEARKKWDDRFDVLSLHDHDTGGPCETAEKNVVNTMISSICYFSHLYNWLPTCPYCH